MVRRLITRGAFAGAILLAAEAAYAILRRTPRLDDHDPSGMFGEETDPPFRLAVLGDSTVTGPGVLSADSTWARIIANSVAALGYRVELRSFAVSGSRTRDLIITQMLPALDWDPDLFLVSIGANDLIKGGSASQFEFDLDHLIGGLTQGRAPVVQKGLGDLGTIPRLVPPLRGMITRRSLIFDDIQRRVAARHGSTVVEHRTDSRRVWLDDRELWAEDLFHISAKGHQRTARFIWMTVEPLLGEMNAPV